MRAQLDTLAYAHTSFFTTQVAEELADDLVAHAPAGIGHVFFVSGGSEAVEAALKLARQYFVERGEPQRRYVIARRQSYHGITLGALAVGGREWQRQQFAPLLIETHHVSPVYEYRDRRAERDAAGLWRAPGRRARSQDRGARRRQRHRLRRRDGGRRHLGRGPGGAGLFQARARDLRPPRRAAHSRRGDVRHGPHRHLARLRAGRDQPRPDGDRQGARRRLRADRRAADAEESVRRPSPRARARSSTATPSWGIRSPARRPWRCSG